MANYTLKKSRLRIEGSTLSRTNSSGDIVAALDVPRISRARIRQDIDPISVGFFLALLGIAWIGYSYLASDFWRWFVTILCAVGAMLCTAAFRRSLVHISSGEDVMEFQLNDPLEDGQAFVAMINQHRSSQQD